MRGENDSILHDGDTIFHYTNMRAAMEHILYEKKLRFSKSTKTNDPREYKEWDFSTYINNSVANDTSLLSVEVKIKLGNIMRSDYKLACFCSNRSDKGSNSEIDSFLFKKMGMYGYDRLRMWSQYGDEFRGVSIAFSAAALENRLRDLLGQDAFIFSGHVDYVDNLHAKDLSILMLNGNELRDKGTDIYANDHVRKNIKNIFFTKHIDYRDENEYRIVFHDHEDRFEEIDITGCIKAVILGDRFPLVYEESIDVLCKELGAENKRALWFMSKLVVG